MSIRSFLAPSPTTLNAPAIPLSRITVIRAVPSRLSSRLFVSYSLALAYRYRLSSSQVERAFNLYSLDQVDHDTLKLSGSASKFTELQWGPVLNRYLPSIDKITSAKWEKILANAREFMEPEPEVIEIDSSDESELEVDGRGNITPSSP
jgi:hypothetical protein